MITCEYEIDGRVIDLWAVQISTFDTVEIEFFCFVSDISEFYYIMTNANVFNYIYIRMYDYYFFRRW